MGPGGAGRYVAMSIAVRKTEEGGIHKIVIVPSLGELAFSVDDAEQRLFRATSAYHPRVGFMITMFSEPAADERLVPATGRGRGEGCSGETDPLRSWDRHAVFLRHCAVRTMASGADYVNMRKHDDEAIRSVLQR